MIIVQRIKTEWSKVARDSAGREQRARLPEAYRLPADTLEARGSFFVHDVMRRSHNEYVADDSTATSFAPLAREAVEGPVVFGERDGELTLHFRWNAIDCGKPPREVRDVLTLKPGAIARVRFNGRFLDEHFTRYEDNIVNVAYECAPTLDLFVKSTPVTTLDALVDLW